MNLALAKLEMHIRQDANRAEGFRDVSHLKHGSFGRFLELLHVRLEVNRFLRFRGVASWVENALKIGSETRWLDRIFPSESLATEAERPGTSSVASSTEMRGADRVERVGSLLSSPERSCNQHRFRCSSRSSFPLSIPCSSIRRQRILRSNCGLERIRNSRNGSDRIQCGIPPPWLRNVRV
jgi:hypothetical protein